MPSEKAKPVVDQVGTAPRQRRPIELPAEVVAVAGSKQAAPSAFMAAAGLQVDSISPDRVTGHLTVGAGHHTPFGIVHGGVYATAAESAASIGASHAVADAGIVAVGLTNTTHFLKALRARVISVDAKAVYQGRAHQLRQVTLADTDGRAVAHGEVRLQNIPALTPPATPAATGDGKAAPITARPTS